MRRERGSATSHALSRARTAHLAALITLCRGAGIGVALAGEFRKGARVTVARFGKGYGLLRAGGGVIVRGKPWREDLCRTQAEIRMDGNADVFWKKPIGNHLVMTYGDHVGSLRQLASIAGMEFEEV